MTTPDPRLLTIDELRGRKRRLESILSGTSPRGYWTEGTRHIVTAILLVDDRIAEALTGEFPVADSPADPEAVLAQEARLYQEVQDKRARLEAARQRAPHCADVPAIYDRIGLGHLEPSIGPGEELQT